MKSGFYEDLDTNFEQALILCEKKYSHEELIDLLNNGNIPQKQIAALMFDKVGNLEDVESLIRNLTGCDGKIREAVALKIYELVESSTDAKKFFSLNSAKNFADATIDINANICRLVIDSVILMRDYKNFIEEYSRYIVNFALETLDEIDKFIFRDKKYVINKQIFKLYWCLEVLRYIYNYVEQDTLNLILQRSVTQKEYTIREKVAQIVLTSENFNNLKSILLNDPNYYVRDVLNH